MAELQAYLSVAQNVNVAVRMRPSHDVVVDDDDDNRMMNDYIIIIMMMMDLLAST